VRGFLITVTAIGLVTLASLLASTSFRLIGWFFNLTNSYHHTRHLTRKQREYTDRVYAANAIYWN